MNRISGRLFEAVLPLKTYFHVILLQTYKQIFMRYHYIQTQENMKKGGM